MLSCMTRIFLNHCDMDSAYVHVSVISSFISQGMYYLQLCLCAYNGYIININIDREINWAYICTIMYVVFFNFYFQYDMKMFP